MSDTSIKDKSMLGRHGQELCDNLDVHWLTQTCDADRKNACTCATFSRVCFKCILIDDQAFFGFAVIVTRKSVSIQTVGRMVRVRFRWITANEPKICDTQLYPLVMAALRSGCRHYIFVLFLSIFLLFFIA